MSSSIEIAAGIDGLEYPINLGQYVESEYVRNPKVIWRQR